ncbi:hypothetical protein PAXRUDRAFT_822395 [Paxillus rubicundulus Ve08.2h10]|uniref:Uncharacterized protein n=1 Tax=Paxillus rubicundulus Ve08.2h10 TaxID=930991 RepID=A0A0D0DWJ3_9AGAM|nr:hypothetical protein PAXRUDRAFT_822395 [Paxillus rubicundulus Ve08.2h10]
MYLFLMIRIVRASAPMPPFGSTIGNSVSSQVVLLNEFLFCCGLLVFDYVKY